MSHPVDVNRMVCRHSPSEWPPGTSVACRRCGLAIVAIECEACAGTGNASRNAHDASDDACQACHGYGIAGWEVAT